MNGLIPIHRHNNEQVVSMRELYAFLEAKRDFTTWAESMFEFGFIAGQDYAEVFPEKGENPQVGRPRRDWAIKLDMAKEISMLQRSDKGKQARQYFIEVEKQARLKLPQTLPEALRAYAEALETSQKQDQEIKALEPKARSWDAIVSSKGSWSLGEAAKLLHEKGSIEIGQNRLAAQLLEWGYLYRGSGKRLNVYQPYIDNGAFVMKAQVYKDRVTGEEVVAPPQPRITGKGLDIILNLYRGILADKAIQKE